MKNHPKNGSTIESVFLENEKFVFNVINDYLSGNRKFEFNKVIPYLSSRISRASINLNTRGIIEVLRSLADKNLIVEGSKFTKNRVLLTLKRRKMYEFILKNPGTYKYKIQKELNYGNHTIIWHINVLLEFGFIEKLK